MTHHESPAAPPSAVLRFLRSGLTFLARTLKTLGSQLRRHAPIDRVRSGWPLLRRLLRGATVGVSLAAVIWLVGASLMERIPPGMLAVEQINWGDEAGIVPEDKPSGVHFSWGGRSTWHEVAAGTQFVNFGWENIGGQEPMLAVAIRGGVPAEVNVCIPYRIQPGQAWRIVEAGLKNDYPRRVTAIARRVLLEELGQLSTDDFADSDARALAEQSALLRLNADLNEVHLEALEVVIGAVYFDSSFEQKLQEKQLATQTRLTDQSLAARKAEELKREFSLHEVAAEQKALAAEWDMQIDQARIALERELHAISRQAQDYPQQVATEGATQEALLEAEGQRILSEAHKLTQSIAHPANDPAQQAKATPTGQSGPSPPATLDPLAIDHRRAALSLARARQEFQQAQSALEEEFAQSNQVERLAHEQELQTLQHQTLTTTRQLHSEAQATRDHLLAQGQLAIAEAQALSERLHNEILETPGGRLHLARQAAQNLQIERVVLDPRSPNVPNILDLDELLALLVGSQLP